MSFVEKEFPSTFCYCFPMMRKDRMIGSDSGLRQTSHGAGQVRLAGSWLLRIYPDPDSADRRHGESHRVRIADSHSPVIQVSSGLGW